MPDASLSLDPQATSAATVYDASLNRWTTTAPRSLSGNVFLTGLAVPVPAAGLPGGIKPVVWDVHFNTSVPEVSVKWQWSAAVYTSFKADETDLMVKPVDSNQLSVYKNSDHAGTPEAFKHSLTGGARGGGGSNYTGSYSATASSSPTCSTIVTDPPPVDNLGTSATEVTFTPPLML